nr:hypothetical protein [Tanacetum cinerariifolium]
MAVTPKNNDKKIRLTKHIPLSGNTPAKTTSSINVVSNTPVLSSIGVNLLSSASGSQPQGNTKNDRIQRYVKLVKDLHTTNFDQLHAYLEQHELHANEVRLLRERNQDPLAFMVNQQMTPPYFNTYQSSYNNPQLQQ